MPGVSRAEAELVAATGARHDRDFREDPYMHVVVLVLLAATVAVGLMVGMSVKDKSLYGAVGLGVLAGPGSLLALAHMAVAQGRLSGWCRSAHATGPDGVSVAAVR